MKVYITRPIPQIGIDTLKAEHEVDINPERKNLSRSDFAEKFEKYDAILCLLTDMIDHELLSHAKNVRIIANYAVGYDNIDVKAATKLGIAVTNTPGVLTDATAELTWALLLAVTRRIPESDAFTRAGKFEGWGPLLLLGAPIAGQTLGIIGTGRIGSKVAQIARGFDMQILFSNPTPRPDLERRFDARQVELDELLTNSDVISLHCPLTAKTHHLIDAAEFEKMKKSAYLINTARGPVVNEKALVAALQSGQIAGAGLDVYEAEPTVTPELLLMSNVVLLPHIGSATTTARDKMATMAADNILAALRGERPPNCLNPEIYE